MFTDVTNARCFGSARNWKAWVHLLTEQVHYYKAGMPCPDYAALGKRMGYRGKKGGDLFVDQLDLIEHLMPYVVCLEMVPTALKVNKGWEVQTVIETLSKKYNVTSEVIQCWRYGDVSARERLMIIGLRKDIFTDVQWEYPDHVFTDDMYPVARDIAVPDNEVPDEYWRTPTVHQYPKTKPRPGKLHHIGYAGDPDLPKVAGHSSSPYNIQGWDGNFATQMGTNGGSQRPALLNPDGTEWMPGDPISKTRMTVPTETLKAASLEEGYRKWARKFYNRKKLSMSFDQFLRELVNLGIPMCMGTAIDRKVSSCLIEAGVKPVDRLQPLAKECTRLDQLKPEGPDAETCQRQQSAPHWCQCCDRQSEVFEPSEMFQIMVSEEVKGTNHSESSDDDTPMVASNLDRVLTLGLGDSGATDHLWDNTHKDLLYDTKPSSKSYATAGSDDSGNNQIIKGVVTGKADISVLNLGQQPQCEEWSDQTIQVHTIKDLGTPLYSLDAEYGEEGYDIHLTHGYGEGDFTGLCRPEGVHEGKPESRIPMVYNWNGSGGWRIPYVVKRPGSDPAQHIESLKSLMEENRVDMCKLAAKAARSFELTESQAQQLEAYYWACPAVSQQVVARVVGERTIRPAWTYGGLKRHKKKGWHSFHCDQGHFGEPGQNCPVCDMFKGIARPLPRHTEGKPREHRPGYLWYLDLIEFRYRSEEGCKWLMVLTDAATQYYQLIPLYWKSDAAYELRRWIRTMRAHPSYVGFDLYGIISAIHTDNESVWAEECTNFTEIIEAEGGLDMIYSDPGEHARENSRAEGANKIIEAGIQSLLYEKNLPPSWWQRAANDVQFLGNRHPPYSLDANVPLDGDMASPIERMFLGYVSHHQVYREIDCFVAVGTLAMCHVKKVKGSDLEPKVRWAVAIGQRGKVTRWMCPFTKARFKNRSFRAITLRQGLNFSQFLGWGEISPSAQSKLLPQDLREEWRWELPATDPRRKGLWELPAMRPSLIAEGPPPVKELMTLMADSDEPHDEEVIIRAERSVGDKDLCEFFPRLVRKSTPLSTAGAIGTGPDTSPEPNEGSGDEEEQGQGQSLAPGITTGLEPHGLITDEHELRALGKGVTDEVIENTFHVEGMETLADPDLERPRVTATRSKSKITVPKRPKVTNPGPVPKGKRLKATKGKPKSKRKAPALTEAMQLDNLGITDDFVIEGNFSADSNAEAELEKLERNSMKSRDIITDGHTSWTRICKMVHKHQKQLPHELHNLYRLWLLTRPTQPGEEILTVLDLPKRLCEGKGPIKQGLTLPYPSGPHWNNLLSNKVTQKMYANRLHEDDEEEEQTYNARLAFEKICSYKPPEGKLRTSLDVLGTACAAMVCGQVQPSEFDSLIHSMVDEDLRAGTTYHAMKANNVKGRMKITGSGIIPEPKNVVDALMGDRAEEWVKSIHSEMNGLNDQGVFSHGHTMKDLREKHGIYSKPIPCSVALTHKFKQDENGSSVLARLKTRICIAGHRGNVTRGVHYHDVFAAAPVQHTERLLQSLRVNLHLHNLAWDVKMAYTWAPLPPGDRVAVRYPDGFEQEDDEGNELFMILEKCLYGMPSAAREWSKCRDNFIMRKFSSDGWSVKKCRQDPCLFVIDKVIDPRNSSTREYENGENLTEPPLYHDLEQIVPANCHRSWVLIHTDDCDCYGTSLDVLHEINDIMNEEWTTEIVDPSYILGVRRVLDTSDPKGWVITCTMPSFIEDLATVFRPDLDEAHGKRTVGTPFPEGLILTKSTTPEEGEVDRNIAKGYQRLVGSLLWCVRHVSPICAYGCSQLCKLMSCPTDLAWKCALRMLQYMLQHKDEGIQFHEADMLPLAYVDASNKDDPHDGKTQYGYTINWGGPIITKSGKLTHVGINSTYNEYMALHYAIKHIVWLRQFMDEMGLGSIVGKPTVVYADNKQANNLCHEDLVTSGNMYFRTSYHYNKEEVEDGTVAIRYTHTSTNYSDATTKGLGPIKIRQFKPVLHGYELPDPLLRKC